MKRGTETHPKTVRLQAALGVPRCTACGVLELLWHFTGQYAPTGSIGQWTPGDVAGFIGWDGDAAKLFEALETTGWLDRNGGNVLIVHDWPDHCEDGVHMKLARARQFFADGQVPRLTRLGAKEREEAQAFYSTHKAPENACRAHAVHTETHGERTALALALALAPPSLDPPSETACPSQDAPGGCPGQEEPTHPSSKPPPKPKRQRKAPAEPPKPREPNPYWDSAAALWGLPADTKAERSRLGRLARDFRIKCEKAGRGPEEIDRRRQALGRRWSNLDMVSPEALLKNWDLAVAPPQKGRATPQEEVNFRRQMGENVDEPGPERDIPENPF